MTTFASNVGRVISISAARAGAPAAGGVVGPGAAPDQRHARELGMLEGVRRSSTRTCSRSCRATRSSCCAPAARASRAPRSPASPAASIPIDLNAGDRVIFSSWAIPGNERPVARIQNGLARLGVDIVTDAEALRACLPVIPAAMS